MFLSTLRCQAIFQFAGHQGRQAVCTSACQSHLGRLHSTLDGDPDRPAKLPDCVCSQTSAEISVRSLSEQLARSVPESLTRLGACGGKFESSKRRRSVLTAAAGQVAKASACDFSPLRSVRAALFDGFGDVGWTSLLRDGNGLCHYPMSLSLFSALQKAVRDDGQLLSPAGLQPGRTLRFDPLNIDDQKETGALSSKKFNH